MCMCAYVYVCAYMFNGPTAINLSPQTQEPNRDKSTKRNPVSTTGISARSRRRAFRYYRLDPASSFKSLGHHARVPYIHIFFLYFTN